MSCALTLTHRIERRSPSDAPDGVDREVKPMGASASTPAPTSGAASVAAPPPAPRPMANPICGVLTLLHSRRGRLGRFLVSDWLPLMILVALTPFNPATAILYALLLPGVLAYFVYLHFVRWRAEFRLFTDPALRVTLLTSRDIIGGFQAFALSRRGRDSTLLKLTFLQAGCLAVLGLVLGAPLTELITYFLFFWALALVVLSSREPLFYAALWMKLDLAIRWRGPHRWRNAGPLLWRSACIAAVMMAGLLLFRFFCEQLFFAHLYRPAVWARASSFFVVQLQGICLYVLGYLFLLAAFSYWVRRRTPEQWRELCEALYCQMINQSPR